MRFTVVVGSKMERLEPVTSSSALAGMATVVDGPYVRYSDYEQALDAAEEKARVYAEAQALQEMAKEFDAAALRHGMNIPHGTRSSAQVAERGAQIAFEEAARLCREKSSQ